MDVTSIRLGEADRVRVDIAARVRGVSRSQYLRDAALAMAARDLADAGLTRGSDLPRAPRRRLGGNGRAR